MEEFNGISFLIGIGMGFVIGIAFVCFKRAWHWAGLPPEEIWEKRGTVRESVGNPHITRPDKAPPGPPPKSCGCRGCYFPSGPNSPRG